MTYEAEKRWLKRGTSCVRVVQRAERRRARVVAHAGRLLDDRHVVARHFRLPVDRPAAVGAPDAGFEQELVGERRVPGDLIEPGRLEVVAEERFRRVDRSARRQRRAVAVALRIGEEVELVLLRRPPRQRESAFDSYHSLANAGRARSGV